MPKHEQTKAGEGRRTTMNGDDTMRLSELHPSAFLKATDLDEGRDYPVKISTVSLETIQDGDREETKPVLAFHGAEKRLVLNVTNTTALLSAFGDVDTRELIEKRIVLRRETTSFRGRPTPCIRIHIPQSPTPAPAPTAPPEPSTVPTIEDDEIPF